MIIFIFSNKFDINYCNYKYINIYCVYMYIFFYDIHTNQIKKILSNKEKFTYLQNCKYIYMYILCILCFCLY